MASICERCKEDEKQMYWGEFNNHQFFKVMMNDFRRRLRIPQKFVMNLKDKLLGKKILRGPSGNSWLVEVIRTVDDDYFFCNGWEAFVEDHCLDDTDLLVFRMNSCDSSFNVMIFDISACEKEDTFFVKKHRYPCKHPYEQESSKDQDSSDQESYEDDYTHRGSLGKEFMSHTPEPSKGELRNILIVKEDGTIVENFSSEDEDDLNVSSEEDSLYFVNLRGDYKGKNQLNQAPRRVENSKRKEKPVYFHGSSSKIPRKMEFQGTSSILEDDNGKRNHTPSSSRQKNNEPVEIFSDRRQVTERERKRVHQLASRHKSSVPCVLMKMQPTHTNRGQLKLPRKWAFKYMRYQSETINLRIPSTGKTWEAEMRYRQEGLVIQTGFADFVMDNHLEEEDICVFELAQGRRNSFKPVVLDVYIYRVISE